MRSAQRSHVAHAVQYLTAQRARAPHVLRVMPARRRSIASCEDARVPPAQRLGLTAVLALGVIAALLWWRRGDSGPSEPTAAPAAHAVAGPTSRPTPAVAIDPDTRPSTSSGGSPSPRGRLNRAARERLVAAVTAARARRHASAPTSPASPPGTPGADPPLDKDYVRAQIRELVPHLKDCYEEARATEPRLGGKLVVEFTIGGEPEVGGLVETSEVLEGESTIVHAGMVECVRETMYGAEFVAPPGGGQVVVRYPFAFDPGPE